MLSFWGRSSELDTYPAPTEMSINRLTWLCMLARRVVLWRSFDWKMPRSRSKPPETKNVVASLPPEALTSYCCRTPLRNGVFCTSGLKLSTATMVQIPCACDDSRHDVPVARREK